MKATHQESPWLTTAGGKISDEAPTASGRELTAQQRDRLIRSVISSQALEGVEVSYATAAHLLDEVLRKSLPAIG